MHSVLCICVQYLMDDIATIMYWCFVLSVKCYVVHMLRCFILVLESVVIGIVVVFADIVIVDSHTALACQQQHPNSTKPAAGNHSA